MCYGVSSFPQLLRLLKLHKFMDEGWLWPDVVCTFVDFALFTCARNCNHWEKLLVTRAKDFLKISSLDYPHSNTGHGRSPRKRKRRSRKLSSSSSSSLNIICLLIFAHSFIFSLFFLFFGKPVYRTWVSVVFFFFKGNIGGESNMWI